MDMRRRVARRGADQETFRAYATAVMDILVAEFPELAHPLASEVVLNLVRRHACTPSATFECIVASPTTANWRLKADTKDQRRVRLGCYRFEPGAADHERERRVNSALSRLVLSDTGAASGIPGAS
jgi:hypothetical protein